MRSKVETGASGTALNVELVTPFLIWVLPTRFRVIPSPCRTRTRSGKAAPACETRYAGPTSGWARIGVTAVALPTTDALGHDAGLSVNVAFGQACCSVVSLDGSCLGRSTLALAMFACPEPDVTRTWREAPLILLVRAVVIAVSRGLNGRRLHPPTWKGELTATEDPVNELRVPVTVLGAQLVGLNVTFG